MEPRPPLSGLERLAADRAGPRPGRGDRPVICAPAGGALGRPSSPARSAAPAAPPRSSANASAAPRRCASTTGCARSRSARGTGSTAPRSRRLRPGIFDGDGYHEWYFRPPTARPMTVSPAASAAWLAEAEPDRPLIVVAHGIVTRVLRGLYAGLPRAEALRLPVPQDRIFRLARRHDRGDRI